jgi:hypothetical protein
MLSKQRRLAFLDSAPLHTSVGPSPPDQGPIQRRQLIEILDPVFRATVPPTPIDPDAGTAIVIPQLCLVQYAFKMPFDFDSTLSAAQNIEEFHKYMESIDAELAAILKAQLPAILPLPDNVSQRTAARQKFNEAVLKQLDRPKAVPTK